MGGKLRILLANEPRAYRETLAAVFGKLRPQAEVIVVEPEALDREVGVLGPDLVVCSSATATVRSKVRCWVELYPGGASWATVGMDERISTIPDAELVDLLAVVDAAERLARPV